MVHCDLLWLLRLQGSGGGALDPLEVIKAKAHPWARQLADVVEERLAGVDDACLLAKNMAAEKYSNTCRQRGASGSVLWH